MTNEEKLTKVITSKNVKDNFYQFIKDNDFYKWLIGLMPEIIDCKNCNQNTPWHIYNVLDHILISVEEINKLTKALNKNERKLFSYVMFLHDIGKPKCKQTYTVNNELRDTFPNHQEESKKLAERFLNKLKFNDEENKYILFLISNHDLFINIVKNPIKENQKQFSEQLLDNLIIEFNKYGNGKKILKDIVIIAIADNKAQNPKLTKDPLEILYKAKDYLSKTKPNENTVIK